MGYPDLTANAQFIKASKFSSGSNLTPTRVVIHCTVSKTQVGGAVGTANGFASPNAGGSAHYVVDPGTVVQCLTEATIAWHAPPNARSLGIEMTDLCIWQSYPTANAGQLDKRFTGNEAAFHARWSLPDWQQMLARTALVTRYLCDKYGIPTRRIGVADLKASAKGICGHRDVSLAFGQSDHIDPYRDSTSDGDFPWAQFTDLVNNPQKAVDILGGAPTEGDDMTTVDELLNAPIARQGGLTGNTSLKNVAEYSDAYMAGITGRLTAIEQALGALPDQVAAEIKVPAPDPAAIAAAIPADLAEQVADELGKRLSAGAAPGQG